MSTTTSVWSRSRAPSGPEAWAVRAGNVLLPSGELRDDVEVVVRDGVIETVAERGAGRVDARRLLDLPTATLLPGLIDSHVHLTFSGDSRLVDRLVADSTPSQLALAAGNAQRALSRGTTTAVDCGGRTEVVVALRDAIAEGELLGPRLLVSGAPLTTTEGHCHWLGGVADSLDDVVRTVRRQVAEGVDLVKVMVTGGNITPGSNPKQLQYPAEVLRAVAVECERHGKPFVAHAHTAEGVTASARAGARVVAHATCVDSRGDVALGPDTVDALVSAGTYVDPTIMVASDPLRATAERRRLRSAMLPLFGRMHAAGIPLLAGTDAGVPGVAHGAAAHSVVALHRELGLPVASSLAAATLDAALAFGIGDSVGSIAESLRADLLLVDGLVEHDIDAVTRPLAVWSAGTLVASGGLLDLR